MWLYKRTKTGAIQSWKAESVIVGYQITFGQLGGKLQAPITSITKGKQKRSTREQIEFEIKALYKNKKDEGYKALNELHTITPDDPMDLLRFLNDFLPIHDTDKNGNLRPMLAKTVDWKKIQFPVAYEDKLDGVRSNMLSEKAFLNIIQIKSLAREGASYDFGTTAIRRELGAFFRHYPDVILDGELYLHGMPQNKISGAMRGSTYKPEIHDLMEYHVYDMIDTDMTYKERKEWLETVLEEFEMPLVIFHPYKLAFSKEDVDMYEEESIENGYEGGMVKPLEGMYEPGKRSWNNQKIKQWLDEEFEIVGYELGKRGNQDLVFIMKTERSDKFPVQSFKATASGTREQKEEYIKQFEEDYKAQDKKDWKILGKKGTVKFKFYSEYGIPNHATMKGVRDGKN